MQRKVFRIEQMLPARRASAAAVPRRGENERGASRAPAEPNIGAELVQKLQHQLAEIHETIARNKRELGLLIGDGKERRMARAADELRASVDGMDGATQKILKSVEIIDDSARALAAAQKTDYERGLTQDIQDHVVHVYEACNFQDIAGQRIGNVIGMMTMVETQVAAMLQRCHEVGEARDGGAPAYKPAAGGLLNGPKLDGDAGHASQRDIDKMFG